jgi:anti-sigma factor ChrR (cupin superfamily)
MLSSSTGVSAANSLALFQRLEPTTMVLRGAYQDGPGRFGPGDVADLDDGRRHRPLAVSRRRCIWASALAAAPPWRHATGKGSLMRHER